MNNTPRVFISYSWTSREYMEIVLGLATALVNNHVDVIIDRWDLHAGHDMYVFMEQSIKKADKVLVLCDKDYVEKANSRKAGVGVETSIITQDVYGKSDQEKFIPIIMESFEVMPTYLKGRMGIDFREEYRKEGFEELLRVLFNKPRIVKPNLGQYPDWYFNDKKELTNNDHQFLSNEMQNQPNTEKKTVQINKTDGKNASSKLQDNYTAVPHTVMSIIDENGSVEEVEVIVAFEFKDTKKEYVIYTKNEKDKYNNVTVYASNVDRSSGHPKLMGIEDEEEWARVREVMRELAKSDEDDDKGEKEDNKGNKEVYQPLFCEDGVEILHE